MLELKQTEVFRKWRLGPKDERARALIASRLDVLPMGMRVMLPRQEKVSASFCTQHGPGYRIYFGRHARTVIILLCGGDKSTQAKDIKAAKRLMRDWSEWNGRQTHQIRSR